MQIDNVGHRSDGSVATRVVDLDGIWRPTTLVLMITPLTEPFQTSDRDVRSTSVIVASRPDHSRIVAPFMNEDILSRDDVLSTV